MTLREQALELGKKLAAAVNEWDDLENSDDDNDEIKQRQGELSAVANAMDEQLKAMGCDFDDGFQKVTFPDDFPDNLLGDLPHCVKSALRQRLGLEEDDDSKDVQISKMSAEKMFEGYCEWEGLITNWAGMLTTALDGIRAHHLFIANGVPNDVSCESMKINSAKKAGK